MASDAPEIHFRGFCTKLVPSHKVAVVHLHDLSVNLSPRSFPVLLQPKKTFHLGRLDTFSHLNGLCANVTDIVCLVRHIIRAMFTPGCRDGFRRGAFFLQLGLEVGLHGLTLLHIPHRNHALGSFGGQGLGGIEAEARGRRDLSRDESSGTPCLLQSDYYIQYN